MCGMLFVGGDLARKGGHVLLEAFTEMRAALAARPGGDAIDVRLDLVTKTEVPDTDGVTVHQGLGANSRELIDLYHAADVFCLPTFGDCLPMVLSEAGAAGLPLVSTAVAGIPEIVEDGVTGLLVPPGDAKALETALTRLVEQPALRRRLGDGAKARVAARYDADANGAELVDLLVTTSGRPARRGASRRSWPPMFRAETNAHRELLAGLGPVEVHSTHGSINHPWVPYSPSEVGASDENPLLQRGNGVSTKTTEREASTVHAARSTPGFLPAVPRADGACT